MNAVMKVTQKIPGTLCRQCPTLPSTGMQQQNKVEITVRVHFDL